MVRASVSLDCDKHGLQSVFLVNLKCLLVHSERPESNFLVFLRSHPDTVEMTARYHMPLPLAQTNKGDHKSTEI